MVTIHALPVLEGDGFVLQPLQRTDAAAVLDLLRQPGVARWWGAYDAGKVEYDFFSAASGMTHLVMIDDGIAGLIQFHEENDPGYRHASVDITLGDRFQDRGLGTIAGTTGSPSIPRSTTPAQSTCTARWASSRWA
jgi:aminoglycoside 6'-N-acetyltransferase